MSGAEKAAIHAPAPDSKPAGALIVDMHTPGMRFVIAKGGRGGLGNKNFATSTHQTPREAEPGGAYQEKRLRLELKLVADVGLLGKPNAGKSTFLCRISKATPKIADYPFTTLRPHLGIAEISAGQGAGQSGASARRLVVADMPGLIENAHLGAGMGIRFLRHVERTRVLLHVLEHAPSDGSDILKNYKAIRTALKGHDADLAKKPEVIVLSKSDLLTPAQEAKLVEKLLKATKAKKIFSMSAATGMGVRQVLEECWKVCEKNKRQTAAEAAEITEPTGARAAWTATPTQAADPARAKQRATRANNKAMKKPEKVGAKKSMPKAKKVNAGKGATKNTRKSAKKK